MLRVALVGAGVMGRAWIDAIGSADDVELAAVVDLDLAVAEQAAAASGRADVVVARDLATAAGAGLDAVINVTVPGAHHAVNSEALFLGLPVLCEKPITSTVAEAMSVAAAAESTGLLVMASQSRRYGPNIAGFRARMAGLGGVGTLTTEFFLGPHFGGFREEMPHVLLIDMAIHAFDSARYLLDDDPVAVYCHESNPPWSWYRGAASATAVFEMCSGAVYTYTGSWVSVGFRTSWNGRWRASGRLGTAIWDGDSEATVDGDDELTGLLPNPSDAAVLPGIRGALDEFHTALRSGETPSGEIRSNIMSLAMMEAAVMSSTTGSRVDDRRGRHWRPRGSHRTRESCRARAADRQPGARPSLKGRKVHITVWNEWSRERQTAVYADEGIHGAVAEGLSELLPDVKITTATLHDPEQGLPDALLKATDVLLWWGHMAHDEVDDALVDRVVERVHGGMGLIVLHSGHFSKVFKRLMGTACSLALAQ